jgi:hypothetical protein
MLVSARLRRLQSEDGGIIVVAAILMVSLILLGAVVIQVGAWFQDRRHLQVRADAGALAGAQLFNECFDPSFTQAVAQTDMQNWAKRYAGFSSPVGTPQNTQFSTGNSSYAFQSASYPGGGGPGSDDTNTANPCAEGNLAFDVKLSQDTIRGLFSFSPLATVYAHARVQLKEVQSIVPSFPLAVPEVVPSAVGVTFVNEDQGTELTGCTGSGLVPGTTCTYALHDDAPVGTDPFGLGPWTIQGASINLPSFAAGDGAVKHIGARVGVGDVPQSCIGVGNGTTWQCYNADPVNLGHGVVMIDEMNPTQSGPKLQGVWPTTCAGSPFAGDDTLPSPCAATITAKIDFGAINPATVTVRATVTQGGVPNNAQPPPFNLTYDAGTGLWSAPLNTSTASVAVNSATGGSEYTIDLAWKTNGNFNTTWPGVQRWVGATGSDDGPLGSVLLSDPVASMGPYSYVGNGTHALNVSVTLKAPFNKLTVLRQSHSGSATAFILCRWKNGQVGVLDSGQNALTDSMTFGCQVPYQVNSTTSCNPDPLPSPTNATNPDCTQNKPCDTCGNTITRALDARFGCANDNTDQHPNLWPNYSTPGDPRAVTLVTTSFGAFADNGSSSYPVTGFGAFYIAGVSGNRCGDNPWPLDPVTSRPLLGPYPGDNSGTIWGYFIKYANNDGTPSGRACKTNALNNCVAVLTR